MAVFEVIQAIKEGVETIDTIKSWFDGSSGNFSQTAAQISAQLDTISGQLDDLTGLSKNILAAANQASAEILGSQVRDAYTLAQLAVTNMESYRLSESQGDYDNARNNSAQALLLINDIARDHPEQANLLTGPLLYILGVRLRVARELDDGAFASGAYSSQIQDAVGRIGAFATFVEGTLTRDVSAIVTRTFQDNAFRPPIITTTKTWTYVNDTGTYTVEYVDVTERQGGRIISHEAGGTYVERQGTDGPIVRQGSFSGTPASAESQGYALDLKYLGVTALRADATTIDALNDGVVPPGTEGPDALAGGTGRDVLIGLGGDDTLTGGANLDALRGGAGDDRLDGGSEADVLRGGDGNDTLVGGAGDDTMDGDAGTDLASFDDGLGPVTVFLAATEAQFTGRGLDLIRDVENVEGSSAADRLTGNGVANWLGGLGGNDTLDGAEGDDTILGGTGDDSLAGGTGRDLLSYAGAAGAVQVDLSTGRTTSATFGNDTLSGFEDVLGGGGDDLLRGDGAANRLEGAGGADTLEGGEGNDTLLGDTGAADAADRVSGGGGDDRFEGVSAGAAVDTLEGGTGRDTFVVAGLGTGVADVTRDFAAGAGGDVLDLSILGPLDGVDAFVSGRLRLVQTGDATTELQVDTDPGPGRAYVPLVVLEGVRAADLQAINFSPSAGFTQRGWTILGTAGGDGLAGSGFGEAILGLGGDDLLVGMGGNDTLDGGDGTDTTSYALAGAGIVVDLLAGTATGGAGSDSLIAIENVIGTVFDDTLGGSDASNVLSGSGGRNVLRGRGGEDWLIAGDEGDSLSGDDGHDTLTGGDGDDTLEGGAGNDALAGAGGKDRADYAGAASGVTVSLALLEVQDTGGAGLDKLSDIESLGGSAFKDSLRGDANANALDGRDGNDTLTGADGDDLLRGGDGKDALKGGDGRDTLEGGAGKDALTGGGGRDLLVFAPGSGADTITDFTPGADDLDLRAYGVDSLAKAQALATDRGADLRFDFADGSTLLLLGVQEAELAARDFIFR